MSNNSRNLNRAQLLKQTKVSHLEYTSNSDIILGTDNDDVLVGGNGDDILDGGKGNDTYLGQGGSDNFVLAEGQGTDRILDFENGIDVIGLAHGLLFEDLNIVQQGDDALILVDGESLGIVDNIQVNQLTAADFTSVPSTQYEGLSLSLSPQDMLDLID